MVCYKKRPIWSFQSIPRCFWEGFYGTNHFLRSFWLFFSIETVSFSNSFLISGLSHSRIGCRFNLLCHFVFFTCQKWLTQIWVSHFTGSFTRLSFNWANFWTSKNKLKFLFMKGFDESMDCQEMIGYCL